MGFDKGGRGNRGGRGRDKRDSFGGGSDDFGGGSSFGGGGDRFGGGSSYGGGGMQSNMYDVVRQADGGFGVQDYLAGRRTTGYRVGNSIFGR